MANQTAKWILAAALTILARTGSIPAQEVPRQGATGILTARLSSKQLKTWKSIEQIIQNACQYGLLSVAVADGPLG